MSDGNISMTSTKPYLLRAFYEWIGDNESTPYLVVNAEHPHVKVPRQYIEAGKIVLNISPLAVKNLFMDNEAVSFSARFSGRALDVYVPVSAVIAIYARENGRGMVFGEEEEEEAAGAASTELREKSLPSGKTTPPKLHAVTEADLPDIEEDEPPPDGSGSGGGAGNSSGKPNLQIVK